MKPRDRLGRQGPGSFDRIAEIDGGLKAKDIQLPVDGKRRFHPPRPSAA